MLGLSSHTVSDWSQRFRVCVRDWECRHSERKSFGGKDQEVEADECEIWRKRKRKVLHGHDSAVKGDFRGILEMTSGRLLVACYEKLKKTEDDRRFVPPSAVDVRPLVARIANGSLLFTDAASAYTSACMEFGIFNAQVDHSKGEFTRRETIKGKVRVVSTQEIDGAWGNMKTFLQERDGTPHGHMEASVLLYSYPNLYDTAQDGYHH